jgi:hypothetical protein
MGREVRNAIRIFDNILPIYLLRKFASGSTVLGTAVLEVIATKLISRTVRPI